MAGGSVPKKRGYKVSVAVALAWLIGGTVPVIVAVLVKAVPVTAVTVSVAVTLGSGVKVSVAVGDSMSVTVGSGVSVAGSRVGVGSALSVPAARVPARAASVACTSTAGAAVGCCKKGKGMQALRIKAVAKTRTAVLFMTSSLYLLDNL